jgi:uncharacterized nucleotidyltransferase DUF6036
VTREQLEHILRAAAEITNEHELLIIGSQSVLGSWDESRLPLEAIRSMEADVASFDDDDDRKADMIDGALGEGSRFHETNGFYAQGVSLKTAVLPRGWQYRLVKLENASTKPGRGLCLDPHDCVVSKLVANRQKDHEFAAALLGAKLIDARTLAARIDLLEVDEPQRERLHDWLRGKTASRSQDHDAKRHR